jgi:hypothetical protein
VQVLEAEHGMPSQFATGDVDAVLDVRAAVGATERAATILVDAGFEPEPYEDLLNRFVRSDDTVDVLAPDHLGRHADITTVPPASTLEALGSRQALNRCRVLRVGAGDGPFDLPVPTLTAAVVVADRELLTASGRGYLRSQSGMLDPVHPAWLGVVGALDGAAALPILGSADAS